MQKQYIGFHRRIFRFDGIFTKAVVDEIYPLLLNGKINKINQPDKNEINLQIYNKENYKLLSG